MELDAFYLVNVIKSLLLYHVKDLINVKLAQYALIGQAVQIIQHNLNVN